MLKFVRVEMSLDEEPDIREELMKALEANGTLAKIRAQLRAAVFIALEDQSTVKNKMPLLNAKARTFCQTKEGKLCSALLLDLFKKLDLDSSYAVASQEMKITSSKDDVQVEQELGLSDESTSEPLMAALIRKCLTSDKENKKKLSVSTNGERSNGDDKNNDIPPPKASAVEDLFNDVLSPGVKRTPTNNAWTNSSNFTHKLDSSDPMNSSDPFKKSNGGRSLLNELPDLMTKRTLPPLETSLNGGINNKSISQLLDTSIDLAKSNSNSTSNNTTPRKDEQNSNSPRKGESNVTSATGGFFSAPTKPQKDDTASSISEEIVEDLEVGGDSARSDAQLSF